MKSEKQKDMVLEQLRQLPIVEVACKKSGISRATFYRWKKENKEFSNLAESALTEGEGLINDMSESQLISLIKDRNFQSIQLWLRHHHPKYNSKIAILRSLNIDDEVLNPEQAKIVTSALRLASFGKKYEKGKGE